MALSAKNVAAQRTTGARSSTRKAFAPALPVRSSPVVQQAASSSFAGQAVSAAPVPVAGRVASRNLVQAVKAIRDGETLNRPLRVAVIGGGPSGACAAETLAKGGVEVFLIERKLDNCKVGRLQPIGVDSGFRQ